MENENVQVGKAEESGTQNYEAMIAEMEKQIKELKSESAKRRIENKQLTEKYEQEKNQVLTEQGQFKELYEKSLEKIKELETYVPYKERLEALETMTKQQLLEQIPKERRKDYENFSIENLQIVIKDIQKPTTSVGTEGTGTITADMKWNEMNEKQQAYLYSSNPTLATKLMNESFYKR